MKLIQNKNKTFFIQFLFILLINFFLTIQNEIQFQYQTSLFASDGYYFGTSVSISKDEKVILIGNPDNPCLGYTVNQGEAYIFQKNENGNEWNQTQILIASDGEANNVFGISVFISNDSNILLIGDPSSIKMGNINDSQEKVYIYQKNENENGTIWNQIQILNASDGEQYDYFGSSISISNDENIILIGAPLTTVGSNYKQGKAYIFQKNGTIWNQTQILIINDGEQYDSFGASVSISNDGNYLFIGADGANKVYIFQKNGTIWNQTQILTPSDGEQYDSFGASVSISNDETIILIGAYSSLDYQGKAYIFQKNGTFWNQSQILIASDGQRDDEFGYSVSISNDSSILLIGAPYANVGNNHEQGKAYIFQKNGNGNEWNQIQILTSNDGQQEDNFGNSVSIANDYAIIGAPYAYSGKGEAYLFVKTNIIPSSSSSSNSKTIIIVISIVIPVIVIVGIILTIFFIRKKKKRKQQQNSNSNSNSNSNDDQNGEDEKSSLINSEMKKWILKEDK